MAIRRFRLPSEIPLEEYPSPSVFVEEAINLVKKAEEKGIILRIMGGLAIYLHTKGYEELWNKLGRLGERVFTDIDFASYSKYRLNLMNFLENHGYKTDKTLLVQYGAKRLIYFDGRCPMVEVFLDQLSMNHTINFKDRLEVDNPTIPLAELLLEKLQIVHINEKDIKDVIVLLRSHEIADNDNDNINLEVFKIQGLFSDWGFWYTCMMNLQKIDESLPKYHNILKNDDIKIIKDRIKKIREYLEHQPKSLNWKLRAKIGTKRKWYNDVDEWILE
jgi:hypothetical protein